MSIRNLINDEELRLAMSLINKSRIPSPPQLLIEIKNELDLPAPDPKNIATLVSKDIALAGQVIKNINSPLFGLRAEVSSIEHAISLFGLEKLKSLIVQPAYRHALNNTLQGFSEISEHAHNIGQVAELIGNEIESEQQGIFYLAGLFHDVGALVLALNFSDYMKFHQDKLLNPITLPIEEREHYGVSHTAIGVLLAKKWGLPNTICNAIYLHHHLYATYRNEIGEEGVTMASVLKLSEYFANKNILYLNVETSVEWGLIYTNAIEELMLDETTLKQLEEDVSNLVLD